VARLGVSAKSFSLSFERRLHYPWQYRRFFGQSQVYRLSECTIFRIASERPHFRLGMTFKARGSSVERNRIKRIVREFFRVHGLQLGANDYNIVIPQHKTLNYRYGERLKKCLEGQFLDVRDAP
jgi:ribonuclease P protein component